MIGVYSRRSLLTAAACAGAAALTACARPTVLQYVLPPRLTLPPSPLHGWDAAIQGAWQATGERFHLVISGDAGGVAPDAQWMPEAGNGASLAPLLKAANLPLSTLTPTAVRAFTGPDGGLTAFPVALGQLQFYVNTAGLRMVGARDMGHWTWEAFERTAEPAAQDASGSQSGWIVGWGWGHPATWRALVRGLAGLTVAFPVPPRNGPDIVAATQRLVRLSQATGWWSHQPLSYLVQKDQPNGYDAFAQRGFRLVPNQKVAPLFAFMPPWTMQVQGGDGRYPQMFPPSCYTAGGCTLVPRPFPMLPQAAAAPTFAWGLAPSAHSPNGQLLARFARWLYGGDRQRALLPLGFPPVVADPKLQAEWAQAQTAGSNLPRYDDHRYFDPTIDFMPASALVAFLRGVGQAGVYHQVVTDGDVAAAMAKMGISAG